MYGTLLAIGLLAEPEKKPVKPPKTYTKPPKGSWLESVEEEQLRTNILFENLRDVINR